MNDFHIREARFPDDKPVALRFLMALQQYEKDFEPNRRIDDSVAEEYFGVLLRKAKANGRIFIADNAAGEALGWAVVLEETDDIYVVADERRHGYIAELYVAEEVRHQGIGRSLIRACENWARARGFKSITIGSLGDNRLAMTVYLASGYAPYATILRKYL